MWLVRMSIPGDKFFDAMHDVSFWLAEERIQSPHFSYSRQADGGVKFRISFDLATDADRFAKQFAGNVLPPDRAAE